VISLAHSTSWAEIRTCAPARRTDGVARNAKESRGPPGGRQFHTGRETAAQDRGS